MFNLDIIKAVYEKELREHARSIHMLFVVLLIPVLFIPIVTLSTYNVTETEELHSLGGIAIISQQCQGAVKDLLDGTPCFANSSKALLISQLKNAELEALLDIEKQRVYFANASLTSDITRQAVEHYYLRLSYSETPTLLVEDLKSDASIVNVIGTSLANVLVMLVIVFSFVGAFKFGFDSTTKEKEHGSFKLYAEFKDKVVSIFAGKLAFTSIFSVLTALLSLLGIMLSIILFEVFSGSSTLLAKKEYDQVGALLEYISIISFSDLLIAGLYLIPAIFVISSLINLLGCLAKNMKEAKVFGLVLLVAIIGLTKIDLGDNSLFYTAFTPILNVFSGVNNAFTFEVDYSHLVLSLLINVGICLGILFYINELIVKEKI